MKTRTSRKLFSILIISLMGAIIFPTLAQAYYIEITAYIDHEDELYIVGNTLQWHHPPPYAAVGRWGDQNQPTYITTYTSLSPEVKVMDLYVWTPDWPGYPPPNEIRNVDAWSAVFTGLTPALPHNFVLKGSEYWGRDIYDVVKVDADTLMIHFFDRGGYGPDMWADWHTVRVEVVPLPASLLLFGPGLLFLLRRKL